MLETLYFNVRVWIPPFIKNKKESKEGPERLIVMTHVYGEPARFREDMVDGFCDLYSDYVLPVSGGVVRAQEGRSKKVAVVVGGGSGHYPAFCGIVGSGFADGAIIGNIFTSPSAQDAASVGAAADNGGGVILTAGNYAGDVMHFEEAATKLNAEGINARTLFVTDDIASAPKGQEEKRRGIAGDFLVFKAMSAAAEEGYDLDEVLEVGIKTNANTRTIGVAFDGCTLPGENQPLFTVPSGKMGVGLGIHGEAGISEEDTPTAEQLAELLVAHVRDDLEMESGSRVAVILNGLGATKYEEMFVLWKHVSRLLTGLGLDLVEPEVGELVTSLDMAGVSLTVSVLDEELERFWIASADTPAYKKRSEGRPQSKGQSRVRKIRSFSVSEETKPSETSPASQRHALRFLEILKEMASVISAAETELGRIDAVAGDGDHGRGMVKGVYAAQHAASLATNSGAGIEQTLNKAGEAWAAKAGGTSGALWGVALKSIGKSIGDKPDGLDPKDLVEAMRSGYEAIATLGKASLGDKTMLDALWPFVSTLDDAISRREPLGKAWALAASAATKAADETASLSPKIGRARPLASRSIGTPDAGAVSVALILSSVGKFFK